MRIETVNNVEDAELFENRSQAQQTEKTINEHEGHQVWILRLPEGTPGTEYLLSPTRPVISPDDGPFVIVVALDMSESDGWTKPRRMEYLSEVIG
jgi:hypothetical protein